MDTPTALITGASRGLGRALASELDRRGWRVGQRRRGGRAAGHRRPGRRPAGRHRHRVPAAGAGHGDQRRRHRPRTPGRAGHRHRPPARPPGEQRQRARPQPAPPPRRPRARSARAHPPGQRRRAPGPDPAPPPGTPQRGRPGAERQFRRRRRALRGLGRLRRVQGRPRPAHRRPRRRGAGAAAVRHRPRRHGHRHAPGRVPRGGHQRPPGTEERRPRPARAARRRPAERSLPGRRPRPGGSRPVRTTFTLPPDAEAPAPPESHGLARDEVRLLAARPAGIPSARFRDLPGLLEPGDLVVVNTSATLPARVAARRADGVVAPLHVSTTLEDGTWVVEVRRPANDGPDRGVEPGTELALPGGVRVTLLDGFPDGRPSRLWRARTEPPVVTAAYLALYGQPIRYGYVQGTFPLTDYQNVYATEPGSAEMASAGRPFTERLLVRLLARGIPVVPLTLHTGVSSPEAHEPPYPERFSVPEVTARLVTSRGRAGRRVVAVGTTVTRALESATDEDGVTRPAAGWTDLVLGPGRPARVVTGLITGVHAPEASHLDLLAAVAGPDLVEAAYRTAVAEHYLWHEFGDSMLFLP